MRCQMSRDVSKPTFCCIIWTLSYCFIHYLEFIIIVFICIWPSLAEFNINPLDYTAVKSTSHAKIIFCRPSLAELFFDKRSLQFRKGFWRGRKGREKNNKEIPFYIGYIFPILFWNGSNEPAPKAKAKKYLKHSSLSKKHLKSSSFTIETH